MAQPTTTTKADRDANFVYELDLTSDVKRADIRLGREADNSKTKPGICMLVLDNSGGEYTAKGANTPLQPMHGIQVIADSQNLFTGFVRRTQLHPDGNKQRIRVDCADWLWVLSRTDISLPLMLNIRSHILAHRITDLAEIGELVTNPRFKDDLTGYTGESGTTVTRVTDTQMEGAASLKATFPAQNDYVRYAIPHDADSDLQGVKVQASVYAWTEDASHLVWLRVADSVDTAGSIQVFGGVSTDPTAPSRLTVTHTFDGAATDFWIEPLSRTGGNGTVHFGAFHCVPFISAIPRSFDAGQSTFSHIGPRRDKPLKLLQEVADNELGGYVYVDGSGNLVFEDRHHRWRETASTASQGMIDETMVDAPYEEDADDLIGEVELHYAGWEEGEAGSTVFRLFPVPRAIPGNRTPTIDGDYGAIVRDFTVPVAGTDYFIRSVRGSDTDGNDETGNVTVTFEDFGGGFRALFTSTVAYTTYLTSYKVRATPVRVASDQPQELYTPSDAPNYASKLKFSYRLASSQPSVAAWAEYLGDRYVTQRERLPVRLLNKTAAILAEMTDRAISDRVTIRNDNTAYSAKVNGDYYIDAIRHRLSQGKTKIETVWSVVSVDNKFWILGTGELGDDQSQTTTTALAA